MDANGARFWSLQQAAHWPARSHLAWYDGCSALRLASERELEQPADLAVSEAAALVALNVVPRTLDPEGVVATWRAASNAIIVRSHLPQAAIALPLTETPTDLCITSDGVLYVALPGRVLMHDLRRRWSQVEVSEAGFSPWRLAACKGGGVWVLERDSGRLARLKGYPLPTQTPARDDYAPGVFRPDPENCRAPKLYLFAPAWPASEPPLAMATNGRGDLLLMSWNSSGVARVRSWDATGHSLSAPRLLAGAQHAYSLTWLDDSRIAVRMPAQTDAPAFAIDLTTIFADNDPLPALGEILPLADDAIEAPFVHRPAGNAHYPVRTDAAEPLLPLALPNLSRNGVAANFRVIDDLLHAQLIDSGTPATIWHRVFIEAHIPPACGVMVWLAATNDPVPPADDSLDEWHPHAFGRDVRNIDSAARAPHVPRAVWEPIPSELPVHPGLASWEPERDIRGLFSVLIQNARARVRSLSGRYLWVKLNLHGDGRSSPEIVALRAWSNRFNYAEQYLPRVYRETLFGDAARDPGELIERIDEQFETTLNLGGAPSVELLERLSNAGVELGVGTRVEVERAGRYWLLHDGTSPRHWRLQREDRAIGVYRPQASRADFLARSLSNFEGVLTQLEDRIASAHLYTNPASVPEENLDWLAAWVGIAFDSALPVERRRSWLQSASELARWHGTRRGLALALDVATGGAVSGGEIVIIEDFRLRRILATLLGVDLTDEQDPLLPGLQQSGNSIVGDTLVLGDTERSELMALYREEATTQAEDNAIAAFYGRLANRATILVHREVEDVDLGLIRRIVTLESPAHVDVRVVTATWPFMVGVASLVGVDTYLARPVPPRPVRVQRLTLGTGDYVLGPMSLDPRLSGEAAAPVVDSSPGDASSDVTVFPREIGLTPTNNRPSPGAPRHPLPRERGGGEGQGASKNSKGISSTKNTSKPIGTPAKPRKKKE